jgi:hypothetical protein
MLKLLCEALKRFNCREHGNFLAALRGLPGISLSPQEAVNGEIGDTSAKQFGNPAPRRASDANKKYLGSPRSQVDNAKFLVLLLLSIRKYFDPLSLLSLPARPKLPLCGKMKHSLPQCSYFCVTL